MGALVAIALERGASGSAGSSMRTAPSWLTSHAPARSAASSSFAKPRTCRPSGMPSIAEQRQRQRRDAEQRRRHRELRAAGRAAGPPAPRPGADSVTQTSHVGARAPHSARAMRGALARALRDSRSSVMRLGLRLSGPASTLLSLLASRSRQPSSEPARLPGVDLGARARSRLRDRGLDRRAPWRRRGACGSRCRRRRGACSASSHGLARASGDAIAQPAVSSKASRRGFSAAGALAGPAAPAARHRRRPAIAIS